MDKIKKALKNLLASDRKIIKDILLKIQFENWEFLDIKKLKNNDDIFRVRKGKMRIIFKSDKNGNIKILAIEKRSDTTYNKY